LTDVQLEHFCAQHNNPHEVRTIDLHNCGQIVSVECLSVFSELRQLEIEGCDRISVASFVVLQMACTNLKLGVGEFLRGHGRFEEALAYRQEELKTAQQAGDKSGEGNAYNNMGVCLRNLGRVQEAIEHHKKHLELALQTGDIRARALHTATSGTRFLCSAKPKKLSSTTRSI
jgi:tetratricopeptide (TPR) repeat protein